MYDLFLAVGVPAVAMLLILGFLAWTSTTPPDTPPRVVNAARAGMLGALIGSPIVVAVDLLRWSDQSGLVDAVAWTILGPAFVWFASQTPRHHP